MLYLTEVDKYCLSSIIILKRESDFAMVLKIDFHVHTKQDVMKDSMFTYSQKWLSDYVRISHLNAIAITNHNLFDIEQFTEIKQFIEMNENVKVYPGIELSILTGHMLLIYNDTDNFINELHEANTKLAILDLGKSGGVSLAQFYNIFPSWKEAILVVDLNKSNGFDVPEELNESVIVGGVANQQHFQRHINLDADCTPVLFSDCHAAEDEIDDKRNDINTLSMKGTFIEEENVDWNKIRRSINKKSKVSVNRDSLKDVFDINNDNHPVRLSTSLNLIIGRRGSGKTHLIEQIKNEMSDPSHQENNIYFQEQFNIQKNRKLFLENQQNKESERVFQEWISKFDTEFSVIKEDIIKKDFTINIEEWLTQLKNYAVKKNANSAASRIKILTEQPYYITDLKILSNQFSSLTEMLKTPELWQVLDDQTKQVFIEAHSKLQRYLVKQESKILIQKQVNDLLAATKQTANNLTGAPQLPIINLSSAYEEYLLTKYTNTFVKFLLDETPKLLNKKDVSGYKIVVKKQRFKNSDDMRTKWKTKLAVKEKLFDHYSNNDFVSFFRSLGRDPIYQELYKEESLPRFLFDLQVSLETSDGRIASGGQEVAFALMLGLEEAKNFDIALIDEPEASLDNHFIKERLIPKLRELSKYATVFVVTHNSTLGALLSPDYLIVAKNNHGVFDVMSGKYNDYIVKNIATGTEISYYDDFIDAMEAGFLTYKEKGRIYEDLGNK